MCTVSVIPLPPRDELPPGEKPTGCRIVCNRDERRERPAATPPMLRACGKRTALMPIDPDSDGSWIGVNDLGVAIVLLNATLRSGESGRKQDAHAVTSRGLIVPSLLEADTCDQAFQRALQLNAAAYKPFRLLILNVHGCVVVGCDGHDVRCLGATPADAPNVFSSSGLGDHFVEPPRQALFEALVRDQESSSAQQDAFHDHHWTDRRHLSVKMNRADARTISRTTLELWPDRAAMIYRPLDEQGTATSVVTAELPMRDRSTRRRRMQREVYS